MLSVVRPNSILKRHNAKELAAMMLSLFAARAFGVTPITPWTQGIATNYGGAQDGLEPDQPSFGTKDGSCGYAMLDKGTWPYWSVAAISTSNSFYLAGPTEACGTCFEIQCLNSAGQYAGRCNTANPVSIIVQITDKCPECLADHFDVQALTFQKLAPMANGRIDVQYRRVECVPPAQMVVFIDNNNGPGGWIRLFVEQSGGQAAVSLVQMRTTNSGKPWISLNNKYGGDWEIQQTPEYPLDISISGPDGQTVTAFGVITSKGQIGQFPTKAQFRITNPTDTLLTQPVTTESSASNVKTSPPATQTTSSPPSSASNGSPPPTSGICTTCTDVATPVWSCAQQVSWGQCTAPWMVAGDSNAPNGWCAKSCGRCSC